RIALKRQMFLTLPKRVRVVQKATRAVCKTRRHRKPAACIANIRALGRLRALARMSRAAGLAEQVLKAARRQNALSQDAEPLKRRPDDHPPGQRAPPQQALDKARDRVGFRRISLLCGIEGEGGAECVAIGRRRLRLTGEDAMGGKSRIQITGMDDRRLDTEWGNLIAQCLDETVEGEFGSAVVGDV